MNSLTTSSYRLIRGAPTNGDNDRNVTDAQVAGNNGQLGSYAVESNQTFKGIQRLPPSASAGGQAVVAIYSFQLVGCGVRAQRGMRERPQYELPEVGSILLRGSWALPKVGRVFLSPTACSLAERAVPRPRCLACSWVSNFKLDT